MPKIIDLTGLCINNLFVIKEIGRDRFNNKLYQCKCICGNVTNKTNAQIKNGKSSCGCLYSINKTTHGHAKKNKPTITFNSWYNMKERCYYTKYKDYHNYGGRGIKVCDRWLNSFDNFLKDMGERPSEKYSIDRIDVNGNYEPSNCRWATMIEQSKNRRNNKYYEFNNKRLIIPEWAKLFKVTPAAINFWIKKGVPFNNVCNYYLNKKQKQEKKSNYVK